MRTTKTWSISLPPRLEKEAEKAAKDENRTKSKLIREALRRYLETRKFRKLRAYGAKRAREVGIVRRIPEFRGQVLQSHISPNPLCRIRPSNHRNERSGWGGQSGR